MISDSTVIEIHEIYFVAFLGTRAFYKSRQRLTDAQRHKTAITLNNGPKMNFLGTSEEEEVTV